MPKIPGNRKTILIVSQTFVPDPASVGQHMAGAAFELARRGNSVRVYASARGYENPAAVYPRRETLNQADIRRFPLASFGKKSILLRVLGTAAFMIQAFFAALFTPRVAGIFFSTSPPLIGLPLCIAAAIRGLPTVYWAMDLNPDQLIALGKLPANSLTARLLEAVNRFILRRATLIVALDRFMADRLAARGVPRSKMLVAPPWPLDEHIREPVSENPFRIRHRLAGKFVIMYSGNHSPSNPMTTLLDAAVRLKDRSDIAFLFVGGGIGKKEVERYINDYALTNSLSLPYQPLAQLGESLSAADVHVVALGEPMVGIIHPCKIYGAMSASRPILYLGPRPSHISDLLDQHEIGVEIRHGDVPAAVAAIDRLSKMPPEQLKKMGETGRTLLRQSLSEKLLCGQFCDAVEATLFR
jgi:glycosyltransferase involved in cell wall biosynthesis